MVVIKSLQQLRDIDKSKFLDMRSLTFGGNFNEKVNAGNLPPNLTHLNILGNFNQSVDNLPPKLEYLALGYEFNKKVDKLPPTLKNLEILNSGFNQSVDNLPSTLTHFKLSFFGQLNKTINNLPSSLTHLILPHPYNQSLIKLHTLPLNLKVIFPYGLWKKYRYTHDYCKGKVITRHILLKQGILNSKKYKQLFLLFEKMCKEVKMEEDIYKLRGMAKSLEIQDIDNRTKDELCSLIGAEILVKLHLATTFE